jgi:excisionase family DNA binding protein
MFYPVMGICFLKRMNGNGGEPMVRLRTLKECYEYIQSKDEKTAVTPYFLRQMVIQGKIPYLRAGSKYLISLETLERFLTGDLQVEYTSEPESDE